MSRPLVALGLLLLTAPAWAADPARALDDQRAAYLTKENFDKIDNGMSAAQVHDILGPHRSARRTGTDATLTWFAGTSPTHRIEVHLIDDKVVSKSATMDWAKPEKPDPAKPAKPGPKAKAADPDADPFDAHLKALHAPDALQRHRALEYFAKAPFDPERAPELSKVIGGMLSSKDFATRSGAEDAIRTWVTHENARYFIAVASKPVDARDATARPDNLDLAVDMLVRLREPDGVAPIAHLLTRFFDRDIAIEALKRLGPELAEKETLKYANDKSPDVALAARKVLEFFKTGKPALLAQCLKDLKAPSADKRTWAAQEIEKLPVDPPRRAEVAAALDPLLADKYAWPAHAAAAALGHWATSANEPSLIKALAHPSPDLRRLACLALKEAGTDQSLPALESAAKDANTGVAQAAQAALAAIKARPARR